MPLLVDQLQWEQPLTPEFVDPAWEAEVRPLFGGFIPGVLKRTASSPWVRRTYFDFMRSPITSLTRAEIELAGLVTSQENACRYCYGSARVRMKMMGFTDEMVDRIERNVQLVEAEPRERELVQFCRNLARSKPRPARKAREQMRDVGFTDLQTAELAYAVSAMDFGNRVATLLAVPPELEMEAEGNKAKGIWQKLSSWVPGKKAERGLPPADYPPPTFKGPYADLVRSLEGSPTSSTLEAVLNRAFSSETLPRRTLSLIFAVIAHTLQCERCELVAGELLDAEGFSRSDL